jgi:rubrerythrin
VGPRPRWGSQAIDQQEEEKMPDVSTVSQILEFAIEREQEAVDFYTNLAQKATSDAMRRVFEQFAQEERGHKARLIGVQQGKSLPERKQKVMDLRLSDYVVAAEPGPDLTYQDALILAMKKEKAAFRLYTDLASYVEDAGLKELLLSLAQEEAKHKLRFEVEYDEKFLADN